MSETPDIISPSVSIGTYRAVETVDMPKPDILFPIASEATGSIL